MKKFNKKPSSPLVKLPETTFNGKVVSSLQSQSVPATPDVAEKLMNQGQYQQAASIWDQLERSGFVNQAVYSNHGLCLLIEKKYPQARQYFEKALALKSGFVPALIGMGAIHLVDGHMGLAIECYLQVLKKEPNNLKALSDLAVVYNNLDQTHKAKPLWQKFLQLSPGNETAEYMLGQCYLAEKDFDSAFTILNKVYQKTTDRITRSNVAYLMGALYKQVGQIEKALYHMKEGFELYQEEYDRLSSLLINLYADPNASYADIFEYYRQYGRLFEDEKQCIEPFSNSVDINRPLRIGYVSGDFKLHSAIGAFIWLLEYGNPAEFQIYAYANNEIYDETGRRIREHLGANWRSIVDKNDDEAYAMIRQDQIDILVDLSGHTKGHRLPLFAKKPAPLQLTGLGFGCTSGLKAMDYRIVDPYLVPPEHGIYNTEKLLYISSILHFRLTETILKQEILPLPGLQAGYITFGYGNSAFKMNHRMIKVVAKILQAVPNSKFHMKYTDFSHPMTQAYFLEQFAQQGINPEQLIFTGGSTDILHRQFYNDVDIVLDPFPYNGGASSLDALWMARAVISLAEGTRAGVSILNLLGHPEWIAQSEDEYVSIAVRLAHELPMLESLRPTFRDKILGSHLCQGHTFVSEMEHNYRTIWQQWCLEQSPELQTMDEAVQAHQNGQFKQAEDLYRQILKQNPHNAEALHGLGLIAFHFQHTDDAISLLQQAIAQAPTESHFYLNLGHLFTTQGHILQAIETYQRALALQPQSPELHERLCELYVQTQNWAAALTHCQFLLQQVAPENPNLHNSLANIYRELGQPEQALEHYQKATQLKPDYGVAHYNLGQLFLQQNEAEKAIQEFKSCLSYTPDFKPALEALAQLPRS